MLNRWVLSRDQKTAAEGMEVTNVRAAVSALFGLVVLLIMLCEVACCTIVWANKEEQRKDFGSAISEEDM